MANFSQSAPGIDIAALRKKSAAQLDLMRPGNGTPWEDRGSIGVVPAYLKTSIKSLFSPTLLLDHIRRPDTTSDANAFAFASAAIWGVSALLHMVLLLYFYYQPHKNPSFDIDTQTYWMETLALAVATPIMVLVLRSMAASMFYKLGAVEIKNAAPPMLVHNCFAYALGPSLLALLPLIGPPLAILWIFSDVVIAGRKRIYLSPQGAIVNSILVFAACAAIVGAAFLAAYILWPLIIGDAITVHVPPAHAGHFAPRQ